MSDQKYSEKRRFGNRGEDLVCRFLMKRGHRIIFRNYLRRVGEIDIVSEKGNVVHFTEVKTVSHETENFPPENQVDWKKMLHIKRAIDLFVQEKRIYSRELQVNVATVIVDVERRRGSVRVIENVILN